MRKKKLQWKFIDRDVMATKVEEWDVRFSLSAPPASMMLPHSDREDFSMWCVGDDPTPLPIYSIESSSGVAYHISSPSVPDGYVVEYRWATSQYRVGCGIKSFGATLRALPDDTPMLFDLRHLGDVKDHERRVLKFLARTNPTKYGHTAPSIRLAWRIRDGELHRTMGTDLNYSNLAGVDLSGASFNSTLLSDIILDEAIIEGVDFSGSIGFRRELIRNSIGTPRALPPGIYK